MNESQWLVCDDPGEMMEFLNFSTLNRKKRLFGVAACYRSQHLLEEELFRRALAIYEREVDSDSYFMNDPELGRAAAHMELRLMRSPTDQTTPPLLALEAVSCLTSGNCRRAALQACRALSLSQPDCDHAATIEARIQADYLRDIFGNPFRRVTFDPAWRTEHTVGIATRVYDERNFDAMPILADALEDAGCANADLLNHCREPGVHVRGCWVVDLALAKE
jgi:hypothetical protein